jgi:Tfp pilus assembly protein PilO
MKKYFEQLRPAERRLVIGVGVVLVLVVNWVYVWPHFSDWSKLTDRYQDAQRKLKLYQTAVAQKPDLEKSVKNYQTEGQFVALEDQAINFMRTIQSQASASGFGIQNFSRSIMRTNDAFFIEQQQTITVTATEEQLVDFLYKLGSGASMIRVRDLELQPDQPHQHLNANIKLVANYQKNPKPAAAASATKNSTAKSK